MSVVAQQSFKAVFTMPYIILQTSMCGWSMCSTL